MYEVRSVLKKFIDALDDISFSTVLLSAIISERVTRGFFINKGTSLVHTFSFTISICSLLCIMISLVCLLSDINNKKRGTYR